MTTTTLTFFEVATYAGKSDRRCITVMAKDEAAARASAIAGHRTQAGLPASASVLTLGCRPVNPLAVLARAGQRPDDAA